MGEPVTTTRMSAAEYLAWEADGSWRYRVLESGATIQLTNGASVPVDAIYRDAFELEPG